MSNNQPSVSATLMIILSVMLFVVLLANFGVSLNSEYYKDQSVNQYEKWVNFQNVD